MEDWWREISLLNKAFVVSAVCFTVVFAWQMIAMLLGLDTDHQVDTSDTGPDLGHEGFDHADHAGGHETANQMTFTFVSLRSIVAFGTLFSWAGTLYLSSGTAVLPAIVYSVLWGLAAMVGVSAIFYFFLRMQETGDSTVWTAVGQEGTVYMDIPEHGTGKVRVMVKGVIKFVNARTTYGQPLSAGTPTVFCSRKRLSQRTAPKRRDPDPSRRHHRRQHH
ncbi:MAG: hypothetical protein LDL33_08470 [Desulfomonile sp.]|nr:hypothetical protein [Desulfomonile sp.]